MADSEEKIPMSENPTKNGIVNQAKKNVLAFVLWRIIAIVFIIIAILLLVGIIVIAVLYAKNPPRAGKVCSVEDVSAKTYRSNEIYRGLSSDETDEVVQFMLDQADLNLVSIKDANLSKNYIYTVDHHLPDKQDVLDYLNEKTETRPVRKARVLLFMGETSQVKEYLVWPIPNPTQKVEAFLNRNVGQAIHWGSRPLDNVIEAPRLFQFFIEHLAPLANISASISVPGKCEGSACLYYNAAPRMILGSDDRHYIAWFFISSSVIEDYYMYPLDFYLVISTPGNQHHFQLEAIYLNRVKYDSVAELATAMENDPSLRLDIGDIEKHRGQYGSPQHVAGGEAQETEKREPQQFYPDGQRFTVSQRHIEYLGWSFDFHFRLVSGMQLFNLKFNNELIAYELSMQDILVLYSGGPPDDFFKNYFDNGWATGRLTTPLIRGVDCPSNAMYLDVDLFGIGLEKAVTIPNSVCVFEHRNSVPLRRHYSSDFYDGNYRYLFSMADSVLIMRQIMTIWNYDYIFEYEFHQNGMVEAKVSSTGYIAVTKNIDDTKHGFVLNSNWGAVANVHQHLFNFKIDLDVAGQKNNFKHVKFVTESVTDNAWTGGANWEQMKTEDTEITSEAASRLKYNFDEPKYYVFYNAREKQGDLNRGYRLQSTGFSKVVLPDTHPLLKGGAWVKYQLAVSKYSENERTTASQFVQGNPYDPAISFDSFFKNDDSLVDEDLVAWVTVGLHHVPTNEDLPVTTTPGKTLSVSLIPFNFFKRDPSIHSNDAAVFWNKKLYTFQNAVRSSKDMCIPKVEPPRPTI